jgi:UDP-2,3-diacylglucosamine hydrolase
MPTQAYSLFISDLHLQESTPHITQWFLDLLQRETGHAEALYILGDFFEAWIGDDDYTPYNQQIIEALKQASKQGLKIYIMVGNRDFLLSTGFTRMTGSLFIADPTVINLYGKSLLLTHGDALCTLDTRYQKLRCWTHSPLMQAIALMSPLSVRRYFRDKMRQQSRSHYARLNSNLADATEEAVLAAFDKNPAEYMIHGHTHKPNIHTHQLPNGKTVQRIVLDAWFDKSSALYWYEDGKFELKYF